MEKSQTDWVRSLSVPPSDVLKITILERRYNLIDSIESYHRLNEQNIQAELYEVRSRLISLYLELQSALKKDLKEKDYGLLNDKVKDCKKIDEIVEVFIQLNDWLYEKHLTKFDTRLQIKPKSVEDMNKYDGFA